MVQYNMGVPIEDGSCDHCSLAGKWQPSHHGRELMVCIKLADVQLRHEQAVG